MNAPLKPIPVAIPIFDLQAALRTGVCGLCKRDGADPASGRHLDCNAEMAPEQKTEILHQWRLGRAIKAAARGYWDLVTCRDELTDEERYI